MTFLKNKYDEINGQPLPLEGVYLGNSPLFGRVVMINVNDIGLTMFSTQTAEMKAQYGKNLVSDVAAYFQGKDAVIQVTHQQFTKLDQEAAQCVQISGVLGCPNMEQATGYAATGSVLLNGKVKNGVQSVDGIPIVEATATIMPTPLSPAATPTATPFTSSTPTSSENDSYPCKEGQIKGNRNSMIYHVPEGASYAKTYKNVECFDTEGEAKAAGYIKAKK